MNQAEHLDDRLQRRRAEDGFRAEKGLQRLAREPLLEGPATVVQVSVSGSASIRESIEDALDAADARRILRALRRGEETLVPFDEVKRKLGLK